MFRTLLENKENLPDQKSPKALNHNKQEAPIFSEGTIKNKELA